MLAAKSKGPKADTPAGSVAANATAGASTSRNSSCTKDLSTLALQSTLPIAERARLISQFSGLGDLPVKLIEKWVERTAGLAAEAQHRGHGSTRAAGDPGTSGTEAGDQLAHYEETSAPIVEMPEIAAAPTCQLPGSSPPTEPSEPFPTVEQLAPAPTTEDPVLSGASMGFPYWWSEYVPELATATELSGAGPSVEPPRELEQPPGTWEVFQNLDDWDNFFNFGGPNQV
ncbi:hypothetical protein BC826DRAFT_365604 [Russula brevipes]|nr:hypothetical protein BC826DRAFT_365604 [Russula brevipes]